jgi:hypothetical protein
MPAVITHSYSPSSHYLYPQFVHAHSGRLSHGNLPTHRNLKIPPFSHQNKNAAWFKNLQPQCTPIKLLLLLLLLLYRRDRNVAKKEAEKISKYKDLKTEFQPMSNVKIKLLPEIIRASETISESFRQYLETYREITKSRNYRKQPYWAQHILREVLM